MQDPNLRHTLQFGIGMHHAGLTDGDRTTCERLFVAGKIQILVATSTLAWGVNTPAHLVVIKGTEYFDAPSRSAKPLFEQWLAHHSSVLSPCPFPCPAPPPPPALPLPVPPLPSSNIS